MARIKAKPMNRLPIPTVAGVGGIKNGYRTPPPHPVYDPSSYTAGQQRYVYTNGTTMPQTTMPAYANQVVYVSMQLLTSVTLKFFVQKYLCIYNSCHF